MKMNDQRRLMAPNKLNHINEQLTDKHNNRKPIYTTRKLSCKEKDGSYLRCKCRLGEW